MKRIACIVTLAAACGWAADDHATWKFEDRETIERAFDVPASGPRRLLVDNVNGYVHVTGASGNRVQMKVARHTRAWSNEALAEAKRDVKLDFSQQGSFVRA
jgi:hypothetical protein